MGVKKMFDIHWLSFAFGMCAGIISTVFIMTGAIVVDDIRNQKEGKYEK